MSLELIFVFLPIFFDRNNLLQKLAFDISASPEKREGKQPITIEMKDKKEFEISRNVHM